MGKTVVLGLDAFHTGLFEHLKLSNIKELWENSLRSEMESTVPPLTITAWSVLHTGVEEGNHGLYRFANVDGEFASSTDVNYPYFGESLVEQGYDVFLMGIPLTYPPRFDADIVSGWMAQTDELSDVLHPSNLADKFESLQDYSPYKVMGDGVGPIIDSFRTKERVTYEVLENGDYDLSFFYISETDWVQHEAYESLATASNDTEYDKTVELFSMVDEYVGNVLDMLSEEDRLILMSDHGFQLTDQEFFINNWLYENGYIELEGESTTNTGFNVSYAQSILRKFPALLGPARQIKQTIKRFTGVEVHSSPPISSKKSEVFAPGMVVDHEETDNVLDYYLYINEKEVESQSEVKSELLDKLNKVEGVQAIKSEDVPGDEKSGAFPDVLLLSEGCDFNHNIFGNNKREKLSADHAPEGIFSIYTENADGKKLDKMDAIQFAPTLLHIMGAKIPEQMSGRVPSELKTDCSPKAYSSDYPKLDRIEDFKMDEEVYRERLEDLGYL